MEKITKKMDKEIKAAKKTIKKTVKKAAPVLSIPELKKKAMTPIDITTIQDSVIKTCLLADLTVSTWNSDKVDKDVGREVMKAKKAKATRGRFVKKLLTETDGIEGIQRRMKKTYRYYTAPWAAGLRIMPISAKEKLEKALAEAIKEQEEALEALRPNYSDAVYVVAKEDLGDLWKESDYLTFEEFKRRYRITLDYFPIPLAGHIVIEANKKTIDEVKANMASAITDRYGNITGDLWKRLYKIVSRIVERLTADRMRFLEDKQVMDDLRDLISLLPLLNLTKDKNLNNTIDEVKVKIADVSDTDLRDDKKKDKVAKEAQKLLTEMDKYIDAPLRRAIEL